MLVFFCLRVGDNLSACPLWACVVFSTSPPPRQEWSHSFLGLYVSLSCGFSQLRLFEKLYFLKPRVFFYLATKRKGLWSTCQLGPVGRGWGRGGLRRGQQLELLYGLQRDALIPTRAKRGAQRHGGALGKSCAVLGKKLTAECFSKFLSLTGEI